MNTPCQVDPELWVSEQKDQRRLAAKGCDPCPMKQACLDDAVDSGQKWGVWGGFDFSNYRNARVTPKACDHCGELFGARASESRYDFGRRRYCSQRCANTASARARRAAA